MAQHPLASPLSGSARLQAEIAPREVALVAVHRAKMCNSKPINYSRKPLSVELECFDKTLFLEVLFRGVEVPSTSHAK